MAMSTNLEDRSGAVDWPRTWDEAGIGLAHPRNAWFRQPDGKPATLQAATPSFGAPPATGGLVVIHDGSPRAWNQELRRVAGVDPSPYGGPPALRLGPPLPRREWPHALLMQVSTATPTFRQSGDETHIAGADGGTIVRVDHRTESGRALLERLGEAMPVAASAGTRDGVHGETRAYRVRRGSGPDGGRAWLVVDDVGGPLAAWPRGFLDRSPPGAAETLRRAAQAAYDAARDDTVARLARSRGLPAHEAVDPGDEYHPAP